ncbi:flavodoxin domain-containing protein [Thermopolyspora sp. NPDC052614]|uniref:flavodoxin family protein n=1 Tax=Thermopolyspora sp. NPDC052614 TaxID=3155682 RepID=UPI00341311FA
MRMYALVLYESMFGNTQQVARSIADGLAAVMRVETMEIGAAPSTVPEDVDLLVVGGPTHAFSMTRPSTRESAAQQAREPLVSRGVGLREWLDNARFASSHLAAAAFDTRVRRAPGSAARAARRRLRRHGVRVSAPAESFFVTGTLGPLADGELDRARRWGEHLAALLATPA